jgi:diguanylate cyclase (GGDEF)-like protein
MLLLLAGLTTVRSAGRRRQQLLAAGQHNEWVSLHDPMTGLPNRLALTKRINGLGPDAPAALLWLDLDDFKAVNDSLGHGFGDQVLVAVANRLVELVRPGDFVARIGGDEFVVLCERLSSVAPAMALAARITTAMRQPLKLARSQRIVTASIGIAVAAAGDTDAEALFAAADAAMYQAKNQGRGRVELFDDALRAAGADRLALGDDLRGAADRGELRLHYQPLLDLRTGHVRGVEALVRWQHPDRGLLAPDLFIGIAEETGTILELGAWVLREACRVLAIWGAAPSAGRPLRISVNVAAEQITAGDLVDTVRTALSDAGANPALLTIEVTESSVMVDLDAATRTLRQLRDLGVHLAIDDFGTGYSSLTYLKQFPIHELKLDKSFVDGVGTNVEDSAIVAAVINLARAVDLHVVAEGVENLRQHAALRALGCDYGQGYLWHRPAPLDVIEPWIHAQAGAESDSNAQEVIARGPAPRTT